LLPVPSADMTIPVTLAASVTGRVTITVRVVADQTCDREGITAALTTPGTSDSAPASWTARTAPASAGPALAGRGGVAIYEAPAASLAAVDAAVCVAGDT